MSKILDNFIEEVRKEYNGLKATHPRDRESATVTLAIDRALNGCFYHPTMSTIDLIEERYGENKNEKK